MKWAERPRRAFASATGAAAECSRLLRASGNRKSLALAGNYYQANADFYGGATRRQEPVFALQGHLVRSFASGVWVSVDATQYAGGETTTDGVPNLNRQSNARLGATLSIPVNTMQSVKVYFSSGVSTRTGSDFDTLGVGWQYRWGGGL